MIHQVHHSSEEYNLSTALRQSSLQRFTSFVSKEQLIKYVSISIIVMSISIIIVTISIIIVSISIIIVGVFTTGARNTTHTLFSS